MSIEANVTNQQISATVGKSQIDVAVSGGIGPSGLTGASGSSGVVAVSAPLTNAGTQSSAQLGLSVGTGLQVSGGALALASHTHTASQISDFAAGVASAYPDAPSDSVTYGRRNAAWVDITAPANLQVRRGTASEVAAITPLDGEPVWDTSNKILYMGDGSTLGGVSVALPFKVWRNIGSVPLNGVGLWGPLTLGPLNSVWEFEFSAHLGADGSDYETNTTLTVSLGASTGVGEIIASLLYINSTGVAQHARVGTGNVVCNVSGNGEFLRISGTLAVTSASGTLAMTAATSDFEGGSVGAVCVARRIA